MTDSYGLAMYFPYEYPDYYGEMQEVLYEVGITDEYTEFLSLFVSAMFGGQMQYNFDNNIDQSHVDDYSTFDWYDPDTALIYAEEFGSQSFDELIIDEKNDGYVLSLTDDQWNDINSIQLQLLLDDGEGYIYLGSDNIYEFDDDGDLIIDFDYTWVSLDGHLVPYYVEQENYYEDGRWFTYGSVPAFLNEEEYIELILYWDDMNPEGYVAGYRKYNETGTPAGKGLFQLVPGDMLDWVIDYYTYDEVYEDFYVFEDPYIVPYEEIMVSYEHIGDSDALIYFRLIDIYNNAFETESVIYTDY